MSEKRRRNRQSGTVLTDFLISLLIVVVMCPVVVSALSVLFSANISFQSVQDEIALAQLRKILLISDHISVSTEEIGFRYQGKDMVLHKVRGKLIIQPGTQIFITDVQNVSFSENGRYISVTYERDNKKNERILVPD